jgi:hypothetical protein
MLTDSRIVTMRKSVNVDPSQIALPLTFVRGQFGYSVESITHHIHTNIDIHMGPEHFTFPHTIKEYYWIKEGEPGKTPWIALGILQDSTYFLYNAYMITPSNTFIKNGHMNLWVSMRYSDIIQFAMDFSTYKLYVEETNIQLS